MKNARWIAIGLLGWAIFLILFPRLDSSAGWGLALDRQTALEKAKQAASRLGNPFEDGRLGVQTRSQDRNLFFLSEFPASPVSEFAASLITSVRLEPRKGRGLTVRMDQDGRILGFERHLAGGGAQVHIGSDGIIVNSGEEEASPQEPPRQLSPQEAERICRETLVFLAGDAAPAFELEDKPQHPDDDLLKYGFMAPSLGDETATPVASFQFQKGELAKAALDLEYAQDFRDQASDRGDWVSLLRAVSAVILGLGIMLGLVIYLVGSVDREIRHRSVLLLVLALIPFQAVFYLWGGSFDDAVLDGDQLWETLLEQSLFVIFVLLPLAAVLWGVGYMLATRYDAARVVTADLFLKGWWKSRPVGGSIGWGVLLGGAAAAAPCLAAALIPGAEASSGKDSILSVPVPWIASLDFLASGPLIWVLFVFAFVAPLTSAYLNKRPRLAAFFLLGTGWAVLAGSSGIAVSAWAALLSGAAILSIASALYRRMGLLSVLFMAFSAQVASKASALTVQPSQTLQFDGYLALAAIGLMGALAWGVARWGREIDLTQEISHREAVAQRALLQRRGERERLLAEFSVARKAQELMLPEDPPDIAGFQLAAACHPAREVGGDLYDFVPLKRGRWAIAVADVSGKGVPAALYMTLTKGLLRSICERSSQPEEIVRSMNVHLHECARRKVFVTLALAVLDPVGGKVSCVRAGHNPIIWRPSDGQQPRLLLSSGIGLGLAGSHLFDRSLAVEEVQMDPGDSLILYSDGITEAMDARGQEYGDERFKDAISSLDGKGALAARDLLLDEVRGFTGEVAQYDDMTLVVLKRE